MCEGALSVLWLSGDSELGGHVEDVLDRAGHIVTPAASTTELESIIRRVPLSVVLADVRDAGEAAFETLVHLREKTRAPVVLITTGDSDHVGRCLEMGADDCMTWPGSDGELVARVALRGRRCRGHHRDAALPELEMDAENRDVTLDGMAVDLTDREFDLLSYLAASPGVAFSAEELLAAVWSSRPEWQSVTTVTEHVYRLRKKLERDPANPQLIVTIRGRGYKFGGSATCGPRSRVETGVSTGGRGTEGVGDVDLAWSATPPGAAAAAPSEQLMCR